MNCRRWLVAFFHVLPTCRLCMISPGTAWHTNDSFCHRYLDIYYQLAQILLENSNLSPLDCADSHHRVQASGTGRNSNTNFSFPLSSPAASLKSIAMKSFSSLIWFFFICAAITALTANKTRWKSRLKINFLKAQCQPYLNLEKSRTSEKHMTAYHIRCCN